MRFLVFIFYSLVASTVFAGEIICQSKNGPVQILERVTAAKHFLETTDREPRVFKTKYGDGAVKAVLEDKYPEYLKDIGCSEHVSDDKVIPFVDVIKLTPTKVSKIKLIELCNANLPTQQQIDVKSTYFVSTEYGILVYRGLTCSLTTY